LSRKEETYIFIGLIVAVLACVATWLTVPQVQSFIRKLVQIVVPATVTLAPTGEPTVGTVAYGTLSPIFTSTAISDQPLTPITPLATTTLSCPYAGDTDTQTFINLIRAEEEAVLKEDLSIIEIIYADGATIKDVVDNQIWTNVIEHYKLVFKNADHVELNHYDFDVVEQATTYAWVRASDTEVMVWASTGKREEVQSEPGAAHFVFKKDAQGCWRIIHFSKRAASEPFP
jgi:hypothetical protein